MDAVIARKMWRTLEPYHGMIYFTPRATEAYERLGITGRAGYFASRSAAMGAVTAEVVTATFFNFNPEIVASAIPHAWDIAAPTAIVDARYAAADIALRELLGDGVLTSPEMEEAATLARQAADACVPDGRPLFAGHASIAWPEAPHMVLWHALTLLREYRGDAHIAALLLAGLDGCESRVTHAAAEELLTSDVLRTTRAWSDDDWNAAAGRLRSRGWIDAAGELTSDGAAQRALIEASTDERSLAPWEALGEDGCDRLRAQVRPWSRTIVSGGVFRGRPAGN
jgi:hypothetical protein